MFFSRNFRLKNVFFSLQVAAECAGTMNYASVMATLAKAIAICLAEKSVAEEKFHKYSDVTNY